MKHFLELAKDYQGNHEALIVYITELGFTSEEAFNNPDTPDLLERYDDMLVLLHEELGQYEPCNPMYDSEEEHRLCRNELL